MPKDKVTGKHQGYGFVEFRSEEDADYAIKVLNMVKLYQKPIKMNKSAQDKRQVEVGANVFIGNLDQEVDEKLLYDTFGAFGGILTTPKIMRDPETGISKGFGFVSFDSFESSDFAIECMNGQYLCNRPIVVQYAFKKDTPGERHGSQAERLLAASQPKIRPHTIFSGGNGDTAIQVGNQTGMNNNNNSNMMGLTASGMDPQLLYQQMQMATPGYAPQMQYAAAGGAAGYMMPSMYGQPMPPPLPPAMPFHAPSMVPPPYIPNASAYSILPPPPPPPPPPSM